MRPQDRGGRAATVREGKDRRPAPRAKARPQDRGGSARPVREGEDRADRLRTAGEATGSPPTATASKAWPQTAPEGGHNRLPNVATGSRRKRPAGPRR